MNSKASINWLEKKALLSASIDNSRKLKGVLKNCLDARNESILIIGDTGYEKRNLSAILAGSYYFAARKLGFHPRIFLQSPKSRGEMIDKGVGEAIDFLGEKSILILCVSNKLGILRGNIRGYRRLCRKRNIKFAITTSLGALENKSLSLLLKTIDIDYPLLQAKHRQVKRMLEKGTELHIKTKAGTDLHMRIDSKNILSSDGNYTKYGTGGNLPAGEVYFAPVKKSVSGTLVIDGSIRVKEGTFVVKSPVHVKIENSGITEIKGGKEAKLLEETLSWAEKTTTRSKWGIRKVCEFGIGLNPHAKIVGSTIIDEKALGTAHIAFGSNIWFGGSIYAMTHLDQVIKNPRITVDGRLLNI